MSYISKTYITWEEVSNHSIELAKAIIKDYKLNTENALPIKGIVCIARGGLVPCAIISNILDIRTIETFALKSYSSEKQQSLQELAKPTEALKVLGEGWIVIDELVDTGASVNYVKEKLPKAKIYSLYTKISDNNALHKYIKSFKKDTWLVFPWELEV
jgi:xanthine phosphoribosyltransferase